MPYKTVSLRSGRGNIKDIVKNSLQEDPNLPPTSSELRIKTLYEHALVTKNQALVDSLGLIVIEGNPKNPFHIMEHKKYIKELTDRFALKNKQIQNKIDSCFASKKLELYSKSSEAEYSNYKKNKALKFILLDESEFIKRASTNNRCFWRVK